MRIGAARSIDFITVVLLVSALIAAAGCSGDRPDGDTATNGDAGEKSGGSTEHDQSKSVPSGLVLRGLDGRDVTMSEFEGKLVVLNFWAAWNDDSRTLIEIMNAMYSRFSRQFQFLAVSMDKGGAPVIRSFMLENPILCDVFVNGDEVARAVGGIGKIPATVVIYEDGRIIRRMEGLYRKNQYEKLFASILQYRIATRRGR
ncbi:MAG TPA: TlpA disulfide reductase family protein [Patescibacteria group bacterium]|nr:TlpA disulfide reductase family protein [Patescibacteria group bacterium]